VGICWQGGISRIDCGRSFALRLLQPLASVPDVRLISLQRGAGVEQLQRLPPGMRVESLGEEFDAPPDAFIDSAAVMQNLHLIISADTAIAHLAGALGRPAWIALKHVPDWRWFLDAADSPWYPTLRLFRQQRSGDWQSVIGAMYIALLRLPRER
jgi:Glycosyltransferase family 9 (heptosyltransferase)